MEIFGEKYEFISLSDKKGKEIFRLDDNSMTVAKKFEFKAEKKEVKDEGTYQVDFTKSEIDWLIDIMEAGMTSAYNLKDGVNVKNKPTPHWYTSIEAKVIETGYDVEMKKMMTIEGKLLATKGIKIGEVTEENIYKHFLKRFLT